MSRTSGGFTSSCYEVCDVCVSPTGGASTLPKLRQLREELEKAKSHLEAPVQLGPHEGQVRVYMA